MFLYIYKREIEIQIPGGGIPGGGIPGGGMPYSGI